MASTGPDTKEIFYNFVDRYGFAQAHISSMDQWLDHIIQDNICNSMGKLNNGRLLHFTNLRVDKPSYTVGDSTYPLTPAFARRELLTYASDLYVDMQVWNKEMDKMLYSTSSPIKIGSIPTMIKSSKCNLRNLTPEQLRLVGEDPLDFGGYFIVNGLDYMIPHLEKLDLSKFTLLTNKNDRVCSDITITTLNKSRKTSMQVMFYNAKSQMYMFSLPSMPNVQVNNRNYVSFNMFHIFAALGCPDLDKVKEHVRNFLMHPHRDQQVTWMLNRLATNELDYSRKPSYVEALGSRLDSAKFVTDEARKAEVKRIIQQDVFSHVDGYFNDSTMDNWQEERSNNKILLLAMMLAKLLEYTGKVRSVSDRDSWGRKRIEGAAKKMESLLKHAWHSMLNSQRNKDKDEAVFFHSLISNLTKTTIADAFNKFFTSNSWTVNSRKIMKAECTQLIVRESTIFMASMLSEITVATARTDKQKNIRTVQNSQYGFVDAIYCTEGRNTGLRKNLCSTTSVSLWEWGNDEKIVEMLLYRLCQFQDPSPDDCYCMVNAVCMGWGDGDEIVRVLRKAKLEGVIPRTTSVVRDGRMVTIHTTACRLLRPLFVVDPESGELVYKLKNLDTTDPDLLLREGAIELVDPYEQECIKVATSVEELETQLAYERTMASRGTDWLTRVAAQEFTNQAVGVVYGDADADPEAIASRAHSTPSGRSAQGSRKRRRSEGSDSDSDGERDADINPLVQDVHDIQALAPEPPAPLEYIFGIPE